MAYTEFYCDYDHASASNLNGGGLASGIPGAPVATYAGGTWVQSTGVLTVASGNPLSDGVAVGDWASVYTAGDTVTAFVGMVTARDATTVTVAVATTSFSGTAPADGTRTMVVGGIWKGPNAAVDFPIDTLANTAVDADGNYPRINLKATTYTVSAGVVRTIAGPIRIEGYNDTAGDGGRATINAGTTNAVVLRTTGASTVIRNLKCISTNTANNNNGITIEGSYCVLQGVIMQGARLHGISLLNSAYGNLAIGCEAYDCNKSNTAGYAGISVQGYGAAAIQCISHDNTGGNALGFLVDQVSLCVNCIADSNGAAGFKNNTGARLCCVHCDSYKNGGAGFHFEPNAAGNILLLNCNASRNTGYGISLAGSFTKVGYLINCGGNGNIAWSNGLTGVGSGVREIGTVTYDVNTDPWTAPETHDFSIADALAKQAGYAQWLREGYAGPLANMTGYPDIGAIRHADPAGGGSRGVIIGG